MGKNAYLPSSAEINSGYLRIFPVSRERVYGDQSQSPETKIWEKSQSFQRNVSGRSYGGGCPHSQPKENCEKLYPF